MSTRSEVITKKVLLNNVWAKPKTLPSAPAVPKDIFFSAQNLKEKILELIINSKTKILLCSFLINDEQIIGELFSAADRGVKVFVLTASEEILKKPSDGEDMEAQKAEAHKKFLLEAAKHKLHVRIGGVHAKFLVVDEGIALLSTSNFNKEPLEKRGEAGVLAENPIALANVFIKAFWEYATHELNFDGSKVEPLKEGDRKKTSINIAPPILCTYTAGKDYKECHTLKEEVLRVIKEAREYLHITSFTFKHPEIFELLREKAKAGVKIELIGRSDKLTSSDIFKYPHPNIKYYIKPDIHAKVVVSERAEILMTANIDTKGLDEGFDIGIKIEEGESIYNTFKSAAAAEFYPAAEVSVASERYFSDPNLKQQITIKDREEYNAAGKFKPGTTPDFEKIKRDKKFEHTLNIRVTWEEEEPKAEAPKSAQKKKKHKKNRGERP